MDCHDYIRWAFIAEIRKSALEAIEALLGDIYV